MKPKFLQYLLASTNFIFTRTFSTNRTRLYCTICKRTDHTKRSCRFRSCTKCKKSSHTDVIVSFFIQSYCLRYNAEKVVGTSSPSIFFSETSCNGSWYSSVHTFWSYRYLSSPYSDWVTTPALVSILWIFCPSFFSYLGYAFFLNLRFWCFISHDLWFYHIICYHIPSTTLSATTYIWRITTSHYTNMNYYLSLTHLALSFTRSTFMHEPHIYQQPMWNWSHCYFWFLRLFCDGSSIWSDDWSCS